MPRGTVERLLTPSRRAALKKVVRTAEKSVADVLFRYGPDDLAAALSRVGVRRGDTLLVHSAFRFASGFTGSPQDVVECLLAAVGAEGNLLMVSLPFRTSAYNHLLGDPLFDVRRTMSQMGIISEIFRRRSGVSRSVHPTHPVLASGKDADWLTRDHETSPSPCGPATPFGKLLELRGKVLFFDVPFASFTFIHYIEDVLQGSIPCPVYREGSMDGRVVDHAGTLTRVPTRVFSEEAVSRRDPGVLERRLRTRGMLARARVGRTRLMLVSCEDAVSESVAMAGEGTYFYRLAEGPR